MELKTGYDFWLNLSIFDINEVVEEVLDLGKQKRI
jgi:hypothetical protein|nr:MAG TPA: hypothetical protein [Caudoviricetes sp.]